MLSNLRPSVHDSVISGTTGSAIRMLSASSGQIISFGTNVVAGNAVNGTATGTAALQ